MRLGLCSLCQAHETKGYGNEMLPSQLLHFKSLLNSTHQPLLLTLPVFDEAAKITIDASHVTFLARSLSLKFLHYFKLYVLLPSISCTKTLTMVACNKQF